MEFLIESRTYDHSVAADLHKKRGDITTHYSSETVHILSHTFVSSAGNVPDKRKWGIRSFLEYPMYQLDGEIPSSLTTVVVEDVRVTHPLYK